MEEIEFLNYDIDGDGIISALTDGITIARYLIGLRGDSLIEGVIGENATRITSEEIETYLAELESNGLLDVDANGESEGLVDGTLILRSQLGLTGEPLVRDLIGEEVDRDTSEEIEDFLFDLNLTEEIIEEFDIDLSTATDIGTLDNSSQSLSDALTFEDNPFDIYKFTLGESSSTTITLSGLGADAGVDLLLIQDFNGNELVNEEEFEEEIIDESFTEDGANVEISSPLPAGEYFVLVETFIDDTNYTLDVAATSITLPDDNAGNTFVQARDIGSLSDAQTFNDFIGTIDFVDIYSFTLDAESGVTAALSGISDGADIDLFIIEDINNNGEEDEDEFIDGSFEGGNADEALDTFLPAGNYFLVVEQFDGDSTYELTISATEAVGIPLLSDATDLGILSDPITETGSVNDANPVDVFSFTVETLGQVTLTLDGLSIDADLLLIEDFNGNGELDDDLLEEGEGEILNASIESGTTAETITEFLQPGTYFVQVEQFEQGATDYSLNLTTQPFTPGADTAGSTIAEGLDLGVVDQDNPAMASEFMSEQTDTLDYFVFQIDEQSDVTIEVGALAGNVGIALIQDVNNDGVVDDDEIIDISDAEEGEEEFIFATDLQAGTYIVEAEWFSGQVPYDVTVSSIRSTTPIDEAPNTFAEARNEEAVPIPLNGPASTRIGFVGDRDPVDLYRFLLIDDTDIEISLTGLMADADISLIADNNNDGVLDSGEVIAISANNNDNNELIQVNGAAPGEFFIEVAQFRGNTPYILDLSGTPAPERIEPELPFGNALAIAIAQPSAEFSVSDAVSPGDLNDFYRFRVTQPGIFTANLTGLTEDADVILIRDYNRNMLIDPVADGVFDGTFNQFIDREEVEIIAWEPNRDATAESIRAFLEPGNYAVQVTSLPQKQTTNYNLETRFQAARTDPLAIDINATLTEAAQSSLNDTLELAVQEATEFWELALSHSTFNGVHNIAISVDVDDLGDGVLASAGPTASRKDANGRAMSTAGDVIINNNPTILALFERDLQYFYDTMIHEFAHILGFFGGQDALSDRRSSATSSSLRIVNLPVSLADRNLLDTTDSENPVYEGNSFAGLAYGELLGNFQPTDIPLTQGVGEGSDLSHWSERTFRNEMMTDSGSPGIDELLGSITVGAIRDLGYNVNYGAIEPYMLVM